jgi:hypothetical protein
MTSSVILLGVPAIIIIQYYHPTISEFYHTHRGLSGLLRYIWIGDYLLPHIRSSMNELDIVEVRLLECTTEMEQILISSMNVIINDNQQQQQQEGRNPQSPPVDPKYRTRIALYSSTLDTLASSIDSIMTYNDDDVKRRKKYLSNTIVRLMDDLDKLLSSSSSSSSSSS